MSPLEIFIIMQCVVKFVNKCEFLTTRYKAYGEKERLLLFIHFFLSLVSLVNVYKQCLFFFNIMHSCPLLIIFENFHSIIKANIKSQLNMFFCFFFPQNTASLQTFSEFFWLLFVVFSCKRTGARLLTSRTIFIYTTATVAICCDYWYLIKIKSP